MAREHPERQDEGEGELLTGVLRHTRIALTLLSLVAKHRDNVVMTDSSSRSFPGGSKSRVNRAGDAVRSGTATDDDYAVIEEWRASHRNVLNTFQANLRLRTRNKNITVAQRHKRKRTIFGKLDRFPKMQLARMDDAAGCRLIFEDIEQLNEFRADFHQARFKHERRNEVDRYDYIKNPKETGYRGIHDVYEYNVQSQVGAGLRGLYVEVQYRTLVQHAWATAVEVVGLITESQPKFQQGDSRYLEAMALASEILARAFEDQVGPYPELDGREAVRRFLALDEELGLLSMLRALNAADSEVRNNANTILIMSDTELETRTFRSAPDALRALFQLEAEMPDRDIVLVRAESGEEVRLAFRNYFSDAADFIAYVEQGFSSLLGS